MSVVASDVVNGRDRLHPLHFALTVVGVGSRRSSREFRLGASQRFAPRIMAPFALANDPND